MSGTNFGGTVWTPTNNLIGTASYIWNGTTWVPDPGGGGSGGTVTITGPLPSGSNAIGSVSVSNFPATQPVSGTVGVNNFPATQPVSLTTLPALTAGTAQIGLVTAGGYTASVQVTPTVTAAAYTAGQCVGSLITLAGAARIAAGTGLIQAVTASFISGVQPSLDVILFNANPTGSTTTDHTALAIATADLAKVVGVVHLTDATLLGATTPSFVQGEQWAMPFKLPAGTSLFASVVTRTAITLTSTADMTVSANLLQD